MKHGEEIPAEYTGRILHGDFSVEIKRRLEEFIAIFQALERIESPSLNYIAAWKDEDKTIWYEYASSRITDLLGCKTENLPETFRKSVREHRIYKSPDDSRDVHIKNIKIVELDQSRKRIRAKREERGLIEAIYKISVSNGDIIWLKDLANIENYKKDRIFISIGSLTDVTKEMEFEKKVEEQLIKIHEMAKIGYEDAIIMHRINNYVSIAKSNLELLNKYWAPIALLISILRTMPRFIKEMETGMIKTGEKPNTKFLEDYWKQAKLIIEKNGDENTKKNIESITGKINLIKTGKEKEVQKLKIFWEETIEKEIEKNLSTLPCADKLIQDMPPTIEDAGRGLGKIIQIIRNIKMRAREKTFHPERIDVFSCIREAIWSSSTEPNFRELFYNKMAAITLQLNKDKPITITETDSMDKTSIIKERKQVEKAFSRAGVLGKLFLMADDGQLEQVFSILFGNAAYAMKEKGEKAKLSISAREEGENVVIDIEDNGKGINRKISENIFDLCFTTKGKKGNGLGLTVALDFIKQHHGRIEVKSEEYKYTRLTITLPQKIDGRGQGLSNN